MFNTINDALINDEEVVASSRPLRTMGQNLVDLRHPIIHFFTSLGVSKQMNERCEQCGASN